MWNRLVIILLVVQIVVSEIPGCDYFDTVDLSKSRKLENGSYEYGKIIIPAEQTGEYDFEILENGDTESVPKHLRGCACHLGVCIRFCCHPNQFLVGGERRCSGDKSVASNFDPYINITLENGSEETRHVFEDFIVQQDLPVPCKTHFHLDVKMDESYKWSLLENGSLYRHYDQKIMSKQEYCIQPHNPTEETDAKIILLPHNCAEEPPSQWGFNTLRLLSIICLLLTIIVYLWLPKLRNLHGYCFVCYMICLMFSFTFLLTDAWLENVPRFWCQLIGYAGYFAVIASFLWLTVIGFDLWNSFRTNNYNVQRYTFRSRFLIYSIYAWGAAALLTFIVIIIDASLNPLIDDQLLWMPGVALYNCWVKTDDWSAMIYFHGVMTLQIIFNITMFILTAIRIVEVQKELSSVAPRGNNEQRLSSERRTYILFVRLFVIMGVTWTFEIIAYLVQGNVTMERIFSFFDYVNSGQGVIIFIMFVLKRSVLKLISNRIRGIEDDPSDTEEEIALQETNQGGEKIGPSILN